MKKIYLFFVFAFAFVLFNNTDPASTASEAIPPEYYPGSSVAIKAGDVVITNNTSSAGLTGHAGSVIDAGGTVALIQGTDYRPVTWSISSWFSKYPNEKVVRYSGENAQGAANWAANYITQYSNAIYDISPLSFMASTYCSKIVWDAYHYGANLDLPSTFNNVLLMSDAMQYDLSNMGSVIYKKGTWLKIKKGISMDIAFFIVIFLNIVKS